MGKVEPVTLAIPTHTQQWIGKGYSRPQPGKNRNFILLPCPTYFSGSPIGRKKAERGSITGERDGGLGVGVLVRRNVFSETYLASGILE